MVNIVREKVYKILARIFHNKYLAKTLSECDYDKSDLRIVVDYDEKYILLEVDVINLGSFFYSSLAEFEEDHILLEMMGMEIWVNDLIP